MNAATARLNAIFPESFLPDVLHGDFVCCNMQASLIPITKGVTPEKAQQGIWTTKAEIYNGRLAVSGPASPITQIARFINAGLCPISA